MYKLGGVSYRKVTGGGLGGDVDDGPKGRVLDRCPPGVTRAHGVLARVMEYRGKGLREGSWSCTQGFHYLNEDHKLPVTNSIASGSRYKLGYRVNLIGYTVCGDFHHVVGKTKEWFSRNH